MDRVITGSDGHGKRGAGNVRLVEIVGSYSRLDVLSLDHANISLMPVRIGLGESVGGNSRLPLLLTRGKADSVVGAIRRDRN
jgi:hypothetical protein